MKLYITKQFDGSYRPSTDEDYERSKKIKFGDTLEVKIANERIMWMHRRFFLMLKFVYYNMPDGFETLYPTQNKLRKGLLKLAGHTEEVYHPDGSFTVDTKSMNFDTMKQDEFEQIYSAIIDIALKYFISDIDKQNILIDLT